MRARGGLSEKFTLDIALWQTIENAQHFMAGEAAAAFFFPLNIPDQVRIDWDEPAFDIYSPKSRLIAVSVRSSSVRSVTLWFNFVTQGFDYSAANINRRDSEFAETGNYVVSVFSSQEITAVPFSSRTPSAPPSLTTGSPEELAFAPVPASNACGSIFSELQASSILSSSCAS